LSVLHASNHASTNVRHLLQHFHPFFLTDAGQSKNAQYIAKQQEGMALEAAGGDPAKVLGVLMDNPAANRLAMTIIEQKYPT
jgi:hypothetical protein